MRVHLTVLVPPTKAPATTLSTTDEIGASNNARSTQSASDSYSSSKEKFLSKSTPSIAQVLKSTASKLPTTVIIQEDDDTSAFYKTTQWPPTAVSVGNSCVSSDTCLNTTRATPSKNDKCLPGVIVGLMAAIQPSTYDMSTILYKNITCRTLKITGIEDRNRCWLNGSNWKFKGPVLAMLLANLAVVAIVLRISFKRVERTNYVQTIRGIPQGTKLSPLLFAIMVNELVKDWGPRAKYVDDLTVMEVVPRNSLSVMGYTVNSINTFISDNNMSLNPKKCKSMAVDFLHYNSVGCPPLVTGGSVIECVKSFKFLGVYLSSDLTWGEHTDYIVKRANRRLYAIRTLKRFGVSQADIVGVYCTLIRPLLEYATPSFVNLPQCLSQALGEVQKRVLAIVFPNLAYADALAASRIATLAERREEACKKLIRTLTLSNPVFNIFKSRLAQPSKKYNLWSSSTS
ncbi:hypothetical protein AWC38_SpisGene9896 [Stylophora pistillata]|uniref:Reverse transcriptase domain-containing protein n=1 Tax=Stylophora pistillata TaxID=50429 RepID=A0A2B4S8Q5_STYPI|nr:hypothetical protein AWC38_SpisGene9896 [Stylophora pistillata]